MMSTKLTQVFNNLPPEAQQALVENHLARLVDLLPKDKSKNILLAATQLERKYKDAPQLDLRAKRKQISALLDDLARDSKVSFIKERSNREELLAETLHSLVSWINDIWSVVYEHHINFTLAHTCLLFIADVLAQLSGNTSLGGCKCTIMNLPIHLELKDKRNKILKRFSIVGPQNLDRILLWVWRDLFVSLLAEGTEGETKKIPIFLEDIETSLGIGALERILYGGKSSEDGDSAEFHDCDSNAETIDSEIDDPWGHHVSAEDDDNDSDFYTDDSHERCTCNFHANYWPDRLDQERIALREQVENRLFTFFEVAPSLATYNTLMALSQNARQTDKRVDSILAKVAGDTPNNLAGALDIRISNNEPAKIISLLDSHSYLLRSRDAVILQCAVGMLNHSQFHSRGIAILEKELTDCVRATYNTVRSCFAHIEDEANRRDVQEILKLRNGTPERKARVEAWGERVITLSSGPMHPMAFAAMMMGLPLMPGGDGDDDADILNFVDLDEDDPDFDDIRDEYRPNLKAIFGGWNHIGHTLMGGAAVLERVYWKALEFMPWLRSSDLIAEMTNRLRERPNKLYVAEALNNLSAFAKLQRKKLKLVKNVARSFGISDDMGTAPAKTNKPVASGSGLQSSIAQSGNAANHPPVASSSGSLSAPQPTYPPPPAPQPTQAPTSSLRLIPFAFGGAPSGPSTPPPVSPPLFSLVPGSMEDVD